MIHVAYPFVGDTMGGAWHSTFSLIKQLPSAIEPKIYLQKKGPISEYLDSQKEPYSWFPEVKVDCSPTLINQISLITHNKKIVPAILKNDQIDIVHTNDFRNHLSWLIPSKLCGYRTLWHQRSADASRKTAFYSRFADKIIAISHYVHENLKKTMHRRSEIVFNPVENFEQNDYHKTFKNEIFLNYGIEPHAKIVLYFGGLLSQKRPLFFVRLASEIIKRSRSPVYFFMLGQDKENLGVELYKEIQKFSLQEKCFYMGLQPNVASWLKLGDLTIVPAEKEGFGRVIIESMLAKTPVIASNHGGHKEIIRSGKNGFLAELDNLEDFLSLSLSCLNNEFNLETIVNNAYTFSTQKFSVHLHRDKMMSIYFSLVSDKKEKIT